MMMSVSCSIKFTAICGILITVAACGGGQQPQTPIPTPPPEEPISAPTVQTRINLSDKMTIEDRVLKNIANLSNRGFDVSWNDCDQHARWGLDRLREEFIDPRSYEKILGALNTVRIHYSDLGRAARVYAGCGETADRPFNKLDYNDRVLIALSS